MSPPGHDRPNVLVIHCDQLRYDGVGADGSPAARTPHIDALAVRGRRFTRHVVANTLCCPSRASLLTGLLPGAHGLWANGAALSRRDHAPAPLDWTDGDGPAALDAQPPTLGDAFAAAGYATAAFGKIHLQPLLSWGEYGFAESVQTWQTGGLTPDWTGPHYGFEHVEFILGHHEKWQVTAGNYAGWLAERDAALVQSIVDDPPRGPHQLYPSPIPTAELHHTTFLAERFEAYLDAREAAKPFAAFVGFPGPHHPFSPTPDVLAEFDDWADPGPADPDGALLEQSEAIRRILDMPPQIDMRYEPPGLVPAARRSTAAMICQIDRAVGRILAALDARGLTENTLICFTSDHGDFLGDHGLLFKHACAADCLLRVPLILAGPGVDAGVDDDVVSNTDVLPTLAALAAVEAPPLTHGIDRSRPGSGRDHRALAECYGALNNRCDRRFDNFTLYDDCRRYTVYPRLGWREMFDHAVDPAETRNLAQADGPTADALHADLADRYLGAAMPVSRRWGVF